MSEKAGRRADADRHYSATWAYMTR